MEIILSLSFVANVFKGMSHTLLCVHLCALCSDGECKSEPCSAMFLPAEVEGKCDASLCIHTASARPAKQLP